MDELIMSTARKTKIGWDFLSNKRCWRAILTVVLSALRLVGKHRSRSFFENESGEQQTPIKNLQKKSECREYGQILQFFARWKIQTLFSPDLEILALFSLVNLEVGTGAKVSSATEFESAFINAVILRHQRLFHRRQVGAKRAVAQWKALNLFAFEIDNPKETNVIWRRASRNIHAVYSVQKQLFIELQISNFFSDWTLKYLVYWIDQFENLDKVRYKVKFRFWYGVQFMK